MTLNVIKNLLIIFILVCISASCTDINKVYNKQFNFYSFYQDMTIIENSGLLRTEDAHLLKSFIDRKILKDSVTWLKTKSYKELFLLQLKMQKMEIQPQFLICHGKPIIPYILQCHHLIQTKEMSY